MYYTVPFKIDQKSGILKTTRKLDYDKGQKAYTFKVCTSERYKSHSCRTEAGIVVVFVKDKNDNAPVFSQTIYRHSVASVFPMGTVVATPFAYDSVDSIVSTYSYEIMGNRKEMYVDIDRNTGVVKLNENFETIADNVVFLDYILVARDISNKKLFAKAKLNIKVYHHQGMKIPNGKSNNIFPTKHLRSKDANHLEKNNNACCCLVPCSDKSSIQP